MYTDVFAWCFADMGPYAMFSDAGKREYKLPMFFLLVPNRYLKAHPWLEVALRYALLFFNSTTCRTDFVSQLCSFLFSNCMQEE